MLQNQFNAAEEYARQEYLKSLNKTQVLTNSINRVGINNLRGSA